LCCYQAESDGNAAEGTVAKKPNEKKDIAFYKKENDNLRNKV
jgi:hypothetical protein